LVLLEAGAPNHRWPQRVSTPELPSTQDRVIVITYAVYDEAELASYAPRIVHVDEANRPIEADEAVQRAGSNLVWMRDRPTRHLG